MRQVRRFGGGWIAFAALVLVACGGPAGEAPAPAAPAPAPAAEGAPAPTVPVGSWVAFAIDGQEIGDAAEVTMTVDAEGRIAGKSGCNRYTTAATFEGGTVAVGPVAGTRMACGDPQDAIEMRFLGALEAVAAFEADGDALRFLDREGAVRIELRPSGEGGEPA